MISNENQLISNDIDMNKNVKDIFSENQKLNIDFKI